MEVACDLAFVKDPDSRRSNLNYLTRHIEDSLSTRPGPSHPGCPARCRRCLARLCCLWLGRRYGNYLVALYLLTKSFYLTNVIGQFFLMNRYIGTNYTLYGIDLLRDLLEGHMWEESGNFPRITLCDFEIRKLANIHRHTVQCVLPINMFNEKIYIFLWFWFVIVSVITATSCITWSARTLIPAVRLRFVCRFLKYRDLMGPTERRKSVLFVNDFLRSDGVFILRLIEQNAGEIVTAELVERLWNTFRQRHLVHLASPLQSPKRKLAGLTGSHQDGSEKRHTPLPDTPSLTLPLSTPNALGPKCSGFRGLDNTAVKTTRRLPGIKRQSATAASVTMANKTCPPPLNEEDPGEFV